MKHLLKLTLLVLLLSGCSHHSTEAWLPQAPDYNDARLWYTDILDTLATEHHPDVFYVLPTCIYDWETDSTAQPCHHYDVYGEKMKKNFDWSLQLADEIFGQECNFYSPYYRQISLESWMEAPEVTDARFEAAMADIRAAFAHYLHEFNDGRDFVLAGFSQGAKAVLELVKTMDPDLLSRMKAAYVIGYKITAEDLQSPNVRPAQGPDDQGVVICYNSVRSAQDIWDSVARANQVVINPVTWTTDTLPAILPYHSVTGDSLAHATIRINPELHVLEVSGYDGGGMSISTFEGQIPSGNYHLSELTLYKQCLQENIKKRIIK